VSGKQTARLRLAPVSCLCTCDYRAYPDCTGRDYPKAALLKIALMACKNLEASNVTSETLQEARAEAIAAVFHSERWSGGQS
jgi:tRNA nucleotidyltransferase (CCA-adding enzyme)